MKSNIYDEQHIGVAVLIVNNRSEVLFGKRKNSYKAGFYGLPGGRLGVGEALVRCAGSELREETGLEGIDFEYLGVVREKQDGYDFIHFCFVCTKFQGQPRVIEKINVMTGSG